jgi:hypothetical protein
MFSIPLGNWHLAFVAIEWDSLSEGCPNGLFERSAGAYDFAECESYTAYHVNAIQNMAQL